MELSGLRTIFIALLMGAVTMFGSTVAAQIKVDCRIKTGNETFVTASLSVRDNAGASIYSSSVSTPDFVISLPRKGYYRLKLISLGFKDWEESVSLERDTIIDISLIPDPMMLKEVTVSANSSSKTTATGEIFKLSQQAKESGNPYTALSEIPLLDVNIATQTIKTRDGETPMILIDGKFLNSGINPVDPKFIESVEVVEVTNAKYLQMGVTKILNIKLKREIPFYTYVEARTRHDIPLREGFGGAIFEFGSKRFAISGHGFGNYLHDDRVTYRKEERLGENFKNVDGFRLTDNLGWEGQLMMKWTPTSKDYFAAVVKGKDSHRHISGEAFGSYNSTTSENLSAHIKNKTVDGGMLTGAYYEHTFQNDDRLTAYFHYNRGNYDVDNSNDETIAGHDGEEDTDFYHEYQKSVRDQYVATVDYISSERKFGYISAGNEYKYTRDRDRNMLTDPQEHAALIQQSNYTYLSYDKSWKSLYFMGSAGLQYMDINSDSGDNNWWRPRVAASVTLRLPSDRRLRASYTMDNSLPPAAYMQTFNTSVDPWVRIEGNPRLVPMRVNSVRINYDRSFSKVRLNAYGVFKFNSDMIESYIRNEDDVSVHTYRNNGVYRCWILGLRPTLRFGQLKIMPDVAWYSEQYSGQCYRDFFSVGGSCQWFFGKFFIYADIRWRNRDYDTYSVTRYVNPITSHIQLTWRPAKPLQITLAMPYFWGVRKVETTTQKGNYSQLTDTRYKSSSLRPWILVSWTLRKNSKYAIKNKMPSF